ncbi:MAG: TIGR03067 domain-containing protein [Gemmataceae bacterium]
MRTWTGPVLLAGLAFLGLATTAGGDQERERLQGNWNITSVLDNGEIVADSVVKSHLIYEGRITIKGSVLSFINPENFQLHEAAFVLSPDVRPKAIDLAGHGRTRSKGIYMLDGDSLVVCLAPPEAKSPPSEFGSPKGSHNLLMWMKREKVARATTVNRTVPVVVEKKPPVPATPTAAEIAAKTRQKLIGTWGHQNNDDVVLVTFNPDGSFSSTRTPKQGFRKIFREPVRTSGAWRLEEGIIVVRVTASTERDLQGQILSYRIRSLTDTQVNLIDSTGRMHVEWKTP